MADDDLQHALSELAQSLDLFHTVNGAATTLAMLSTVTELLAATKNASSYPATPDQQVAQFHGLRNEYLLSGSTPLGAPSIDSWISDSTLPQLQRVISRPSSSSGSSSVSSKDVDYPPASTWASVASGCELSSFNGLATLELSPLQTALNPALPHARSCAAETATERLRVIWIANLSPEISLKEVSKLIPFGPIASITFHLDISPNLPDHSARIAFETAAQATAFLDSAPQLPATAFLTLGKPHPLDVTIYSMAPPTFARRRIKFARSRLFYNVDFAAFRRDILRLAPAASIEFIHFYNPGEATAVFDAVKTATKVLEWFQGQKGVKGGRYEGVQVAFVRDFNECPQRLWSSFGRDGRVRRVACEGGWRGCLRGLLLDGGRGGMGGR